MSKKIYQIGICETSIIILNRAHSFNCTICGKIFIKCFVKIKNKYVILKPYIYIMKKQVRQDVKIQVIWCSDNDTGVIRIKDHIMMIWFFIN